MKRGNSKYGMTYLFLALIFLSLAAGFLDIRLKIQFQFRRITIAVVILLHVEEHLGRHFHADYDHVSLYYYFDHY